ncbi:mediator of RNA polymerase II transcription subunit 17-like isoform X2 [Macrosteles quadrilineatus]|uniref:mediator of RNA polymerase II transcription subunit 17-like isoform X2 n=1 Tax=Macrosteles quadrilineatus TaxID=74068 RepID=UPI0023E31261|nr:mediator of RNA polymerase II transcription subunit 17-like isoform X2 [Macrosteles quadrilineatus]XP_054263865.1 mediator of RNA polymerase II transcription subunit 17-like isoform X2 [Macrosteles quadrilineatus]
MAYSVNISVEAPIENQIQEITYDGQEIYQTPLSMSENLAKLAQKIDFSKTATDDLRKESDSTDQTEGESSTKDPTSFQSSLWPWDSVRNKLRAAMTEVCVLADVLSVAKQKRYMILDPVSQPDPIPQAKDMAQIYARKKALASAAAVLINGGDRLRATQNEAARNRTTQDFHIELLRLRQNWRLKKVSNSIIGDLSYRTAGSKYAQTGMFEVTKAEEEPSSSNSPPPSPGVVPSSKQASALRVTVPSELQGVAYIKVLCQKGQEDLCSASINVLGSGPASNNTDLHWQQRLEAAQNVLFCKELFNQLAKEAVQLQSPIPHMVVGNQIMATVLPGVQLIIGLCHSTGTNKKSSTPQPKPQHSPDHDHVLEHSLHQLLREVHHKNTHHPFPHPSSAPLGPSKRRCLAGPNAADRHQLLEMTKSQTLLEQIIQQAQHFFLRLRTEFVLDQIAKDVKDPLIVSHWNGLNSPTQSCVKIYIVSSGYDSICRTSLVVHVGEKSLKCVCRDGRVMHMSYETQELRDLIFCQIYQHQINGLQALAKCMGWQFLANSCHLGIGPVEMLGNASSCILASPIGDRMIAVRCEPQGGVQVSIAHSPRKDFFSGQLVKERKWENLGGAFKEVRWDKMEGKNFLNKMELLMASLTSS